MHLMPEWYPATASDAPLMSWSSKKVPILLPSVKIEVPTKAVYWQVICQGNKKQVGWGDLQQDLALLDLEPIHQDLFKNRRLGLPPLSVTSSAPNIDFEITAWHNQLDLEMGATKICSPSFNLWYVFHSSCAIHLTDCELLSLKESVSLFISNISDWI